MVCYLLVWYQGLCTWKVLILWTQHHLLIRSATSVAAEDQYVNSEVTRDDDKIKEELLKNNCDWVFKMNVPSASHMGGIWECQIRIVVVFCRQY